LLAGKGRAGHTGEPQLNRAVVLAGLTPAEVDLHYPDYPFTPRAFVREGHKQSYLDEGAGEPVLMLHGNPSWSYYYRHLVLGLRDRYRCIVPDHIGMGLSDKPDDEHYRYTLERRVEDLDALIQHLGEKRGLPARGLTLVLHDWGGMIGMAWAAGVPRAWRGL
jgi:haloalkane dehalogenase